MCWSVPIRAEVEAQPLLCFLLLRLIVGGAFVRQVWYFTLSAHVVSVYDVAKLAILGNRYICTSWCIILLLLLATHVFLRRLSLVCKFIVLSRCTANLILHLSLGRAAFIVTAPLLAVRYQIVLHLLVLSHSVSNGHNREHGLTFTDCCVVFCGAVWRRILIHYLVHQLVHLVRHDPLFHLKYESLLYGFLSLECELPQSEHGFTFTDCCVVFCGVVWRRILMHQFIIYFSWSGMLHYSICNASLHSSNSFLALVNGALPILCVLFILLRYDQESHPRWRWGVYIG